MSHDRAEDGLEAGMDAELKEKESKPPVEIYHHLPPNEKLATLVQFLELNGGQASVALIGSRFGIKRGQLEAAGFLLGSADSDGQFNVMLPAATAAECEGLLADRFPDLPPQTKGGKKGGKKGKALGSVVKGKGGKKGKTAAVGGKGFGKFAESLWSPWPLWPPFAQDIGMNWPPFAQDYGKNWGAAFPVPAIEKGNVTSNVSALLESNGGTMSVADVTSTCGVKIQDLKKAGFALKKDELGILHVFIPSGMQPASALSGEQIDEISNFLELEGGQASAATIGSKFGAKREQLEAAGFVFGPPEENGQFNVLAPSIAFGESAATGHGDAKLPKGATSRPGKHAEAGFEVLADFLDAAGGSVFVDAESSKFGRYWKQPLEAAGFIFERHMNGRWSLSPPHASKAPSMVARSGPRKRNAVSAGL